MSKISKNLLVAFTVLCVIVLVVFCVELFALNKPADDDSAAASLSEGAGEGDSADSQQTQTGGSEPGDGDISGNEDHTGNGSTPSGPAGPPEGTLRRIPMLGDMTLFLYVDEDLFKETEMQDSYMYTYAGEGTATLEIPLVFMQFGIDSFAETFLDGYIDTGRTSVGNEGMVGRSSISGVFVYGEIDGEKYEAWIHSFSDVGLDDMGVAFVLHYRSDEQKDALYSILDTLVLVAA